MDVVWRMLLVAILALRAAAGPAGSGPPPTGRPPAAAPPAAPEVLALDPDTPDTALLRWRPEPATAYRLCVSPTYDLAGIRACWMIGTDGAWPVGIPRDAGSLQYLTLQACRDGACSEYARAGVIGRWEREGRDFYAVAFPLPDGQTRLAAYLRAGAGVLRFYRSAPGHDGRPAGDCPEMAAGQACGYADVRVPGALVGVAATWADGSTDGVSLQVRETPTVYFMFDDGTGIVTGGRYAVQTVLDEYGVKATFFLTGRAMQTYPAAVRALVAGGHRVGNHTWSHPFLTALTDAAVARELDQAEAQYQALVPGGTLRPCFRAPNGALSARVLAVVEARGYRQYTQTVSSMDYTRIPAAQIVQNVLGEVRDGAIVSFHTQEPQTVLALRTLVPRLIADGYRFGLVC